MRLTASEFRELGEQARRLAHYDTKTYLAEMLETLRHTSDPVDVLALLRAMWKAARGEQQLALNAVGCWLEQRLMRIPSPSVDRLRLELSWLRRMVMACPPEVRESRPQRQPRSKGRGPARREPDFGARLDLLRTRRAQQARSGQGRSSRRSEKVPMEAAASVLPARFGVRLADVPAARKVWKKSRERARKGRVVKERRFAIVPLDARLVALVVGVECSLLKTAGLAELFERMATNGGKSVVFVIRSGELSSAAVGSRTVPRIYFEDVSGIRS